VVLLFLIEHDISLSLNLYEFVFECMLQVTKISEKVWIMFYMLHMQIPIAVGVTAYEATALFTGRRVIASTGDQGKAFTVGQLVIYCVFGVLAGIIGGLLGLGGGFVMGPLFLELGVPPQVSFKLQYINRASLILFIKQLVSMTPNWIGCLLCRCQAPQPLSQWHSPRLCLLWNTICWNDFQFLMVRAAIASNLFSTFYNIQFWTIELLLTNALFEMWHTALYLSLVATIAALVGQHIVRRLIILFGRASLIIFILAGTIFISAISLGKLTHFLDLGCVQSQPRNCMQLVTFRRPID